VHWSGYLKAILALIVGLCVLIWFWRDGSQNTLLLLGAVGFGVAAAGLAVPTFISRFGTEIAVTDRHLISKTGFIQRHTTEISIYKVESVDVDQSMLGRVLGYGDVTVRGTGEGIEPLRNAASPIELRNAMMVR
jgi:uncharacterized membrane protein YdbT with pleckstrin-like domain